MPKEFYCAACGVEILVYMKAVKGDVYKLLQPHNCQDSAELPSVKEMEVANWEPEKKEVPKSMEAEFENYEIVNQLNELERDLGMKESHKENYGDRRPKEFTKSDEPIVSTAPEGLLSNMKPASPKQRPDGPVVGETKPETEE